MMCMLMECVCECAQGMVAVGGEGRAEGRGAGLRKRGTSLQAATQRQRQPARKAAHPPTCESPKHASYSTVLHVTATLEMWLFGGFSVHSTFCRHYTPTS
jgi:hypothetical protein